MEKVFLMLITLLMVSLAGCAPKAPIASQPPASDQTQGQQNQSIQPTELSPPVQAAVQAKTWNSPPPMQIDQKKPYHAIIHTNLGDISIKLFPEDTPKTVNNFIFLARNQFYGGLKFHRLIKNFMIQTGDPNGDGTGGPGYKFADELSKHTYAPGVVAMANAGPNTNGSQFFIGSGPGVASLNQNPAYTIFGQVDGGMDVVEKIASVRVGPNSSGEVSSPLDPVYLKSVEILQK